MLLMQLVKWAVVFPKLIIHLGPFLQCSVKVNGHLTIEILLVIKCVSCTPYNLHCKNSLYKS